MKNILYITFVDFSDQKSGSSVRPKKIYDAFVEEGYSVELLTGLQNRKIERWKSVKAFINRIKDGKYDFCYIEPPAGPIFNLCDHYLIRYISKTKKVPIGLFYRDAYWKFADWYEIKGIKKLVINSMHKFDWKIFKKYCSIIYFPSKSMSDLFEFNNKQVLPPGCEVIEINKEKNEDLQAIYVGGLSEAYGGKILLDAFSIINESKYVKLHIVCREADLAYVNDYINEEWLEIYHLSGDELKEVYKKADISIIPRKVDFYMDFAMPVKLLEYVGYGVPIISTNCKEVARFINENKIGLICEDNAKGLAEVVLNLDEKSLDSITENINSVKYKNTWNSRIMQIEELKKYNK